jgi:hypothetical protein
MKSILLSALGLALVPLGVRGVDPPPAPVVVTNRAGEKLENPRIISFDGESFQVAHDGGVAAVDWPSMPEALRKDYKYDPDKAERLRQAREIRQQVAAEEARADGDGQEFAGVEMVPAPTPAPTPLVIERDIRINDRIYMETIGGPPGLLQIRRISQTEITFARDRYESQTVERKLGFNEPRTLLFSDGRGCDVYWVERVDPNRDRWSTTIQFEYAPNAASRPR